MSVAVTLCAQPEHERTENEHRYSFFSGSEKESLSGLLEFGTPAFFQLAKAFGVNSQFDLTTNEHEFIKQPAPIRRRHACHYRTQVTL
jgi:hypothetical protein